VQRSIRGWGLSGSASASGSARRASRKACNRSPSTSGLAEGAETARSAPVKVVVPVERASSVGAVSSASLSQNRAAGRVFGSKYSIR